MPFFFQMNLDSTYSTVLAIFVCRGKGWVADFKANYPLVEPGSTGAMPFVGIFIRDPSSYLCEFRSKPRKIPKARSTRATRDWTRYLRSTSFERRTTPPWGRLFCSKNENEKITVSIRNSHIGPSTEVLIRGTIGHTSWWPLVRIVGTPLSSRYSPDACEPMALPYLWGLWNAIFKQDNVWLHISRNVLTFLEAEYAQLLPWP